MKKYFINLIKRIALVLFYAFIAWHFLAARKIDVLMVIMLAQILGYIAQKEEK